MNTKRAVPVYRGRIAPTPTGFLHAGHAVTFHAAWRRAREADGVVILRIEDLDPERCKPTFTEACIEDLRWLGIDWDEGPGRAGPHTPYQQSRRRGVYEAAWRELLAGGFIYPCNRSRKDVAQATLAPHEGAEVALYPTAWRPPPGTGRGASSPTGTNWRFRVPNGREIRFRDGRVGGFSARAGVDFGDFIVWRRDDIPAYELAVVADDHAMEVTEVVRGEDLLLSTCRQLLLHEALGWTPPAYYHCPLVRDEKGRRLAKRSKDLSLRELRAAGAQPGAILERFQFDRTGHV